MVMGAICYAKRRPSPATINIACFLICLPLGCLCSAMENVADRKHRPSHICMYACVRLCMWKRRIISNVLFKHSQCNNVPEKKPLLTSHILHKDQVLHQHELPLVLLHYSRQRRDMTLQYCTKLKLMCPIVT